MTAISARSISNQRAGASGARSISAGVRKVFGRAAAVTLLTCGAVPLSAQIGEVPAGFARIFNGVDLSGWHPSLTSHQGTNAEFSVEDGVLVMRQNPYGQGGVLLTDRNYGNFELYLEAKPDWGTNGGIFFRSSESASAYQIELAGGNGPTGDLMGEMLRVTTRAQATRIEEVWRDDDWNSFRLRVSGDVPHLTLWVNDELMWDVIAERNDLIADATEGMIGLQVHWSTTLTPVEGAFDMSASWKPGAAHRFRNIAIRELEQPGARDEEPEAVRKGTAEATVQGRRGEGRARSRSHPERAASRAGPPGVDPHTTLPAADASAEEYTNEVGMEFVLIHPGSMVVGRFEPTCPSWQLEDGEEADERPERRGPRQDPRARWNAEDHRLCEEFVAREATPGYTVSIGRPFYIGRYPVTQEEWSRVMGTNPSVFQGDMVDGDSGRHPVDNVSWEDAQSFVARLTEMDPTARYRLPTEFEWEYAARAGADVDLPWSEVRDHAWIALVEKGTTQPVGQKRPNAWGLHDMLGNVWEWVEDYYNHRLFPDPTPPSTGTVRVLRGGSFLGDVKNVSYFERGAGPGNAFDVGFRVVREGD